MVVGRGIVERRRGAWVIGRRGAAAEPDGVERAARGFRRRERVRPRESRDRPTWVDRGGHAGGGNAAEGEPTARVERDDDGDDSALRNASDECAVMPLPPSATPETVSTGSGILCTTRSPPPAVAMNVTAYAYRATDPLNDGGIPGGRHRATRKASDLFASTTTSVATSLAGDRAKNRSPGASPPPLVLAPPPLDDDEADTPLGGRTHAGSRRSVPCHSHVMAETRTGSLSASSAPSTPTVSTARRTWKSTPGTTARSRSSAWSRSVCLPMPAHAPRFLLGLMSNLKFCQQRANGGSRAE